MEFQLYFPLLKTKHPGFPGVSVVPLLYVDIPTFPEGRYIWRKNWPFKQIVTIKSLKEIIQKLTSKFSSIEEILHEFCCAWTVVSLIPQDVSMWFFGCSILSDWITTFVDVAGDADDIVERSSSESWSEVVSSLLNESWLECVCCCITQFNVILVDCCRKGNSSVWNTRP